MLKRLKDTLAALTKEPDGLLDEDAEVQLFRTLKQPVPPQVNWWNVIGFAAIFLLFVQVLTGALLAIYYQPTLEVARNSVSYISSSVSFGWLVRSFHRWAADLLLLLIGVHMVRVLLTQAYRHPREWNWVLGVALLVTVVAFRFTGAMLPGDNNAYWVAVHEAELMGKLPLFGSAVQGVIFGGSSIGSESLSRFNSFHTLILPACATLLVLLHLYLLKRQGFASVGRSVNGNGNGNGNRNDAGEAKDDDCARITGQQTRVYDLLAMAPKALNDEQRRDLELKAEGGGGRYSWVDKAEHDTLLVRCADAETASDLAEVVPSLQIHYLDPGQKHRGIIRRYFPHFALQVAIAVTLTSMVLFAAAILVPARVGPPLDLLGRPARLSPEWYLRGTDFLFRNLNAALAYGVTFLMWGTILLIPVVDNRLKSVSRGHRISAAIALLMIALLLTFTVLGYVS